MKVGRSAFDEDAIREIEERNPDVEFDWTRILQGQPEPAPPRDPGPERRERRSGRGERSGERRSEDRARPVRTPAEPSSQPARSSRPAGTVPVFDEPAESPARLEPEPLLVQALDEPDGVAAAEPAAPLSPAAERLGFEGLQRLRARHAEILARIADRGLPPATQDELRLEADRLNPDGWVTADEVTRGLDEYEHVLSSLRAVVGQRRRRRRRGGRSPSEAPGPGEPAGEARESSGGLGADLRDDRQDEAPESNDTGE